MKVSTYIAQFIKAKGISAIFELQGGMITRILDEIHHEGGIKIVSMHHEQAVAMAADAFGRITNKPGIAIVTSGPGATNLLTGVGNCFFDSVPAIFITGQVNNYEQKGDKPTRQLGFQETDIVSIAKPITKKTFAIKIANDIPSVFDEAYQIAISGRPGPVLIDIPMDIQQEEIIIPKFTTMEITSENKFSQCTDFFQNFRYALGNSKRPLILVGRGIRTSGSIEKFYNFINKYHIPVVTSLLGFDVLPYKHPLRVGFIGSYGNRWANYALGSTDLILVLGSRLDIRQTGADIESFQQGKKIFHVDIDEAELKNRITDCFTLVSNLFDFFSNIEDIDAEYLAPTTWISEIETKKKERLDTKELENITGINPNIFIHALSKASHAA